MAQAIPYIIMAVGTAASMKAQRDQQKEQQRILNRAMERTDDTTNKTSQQIVEEGKKYNPEQRMQDMAEQERLAYQRSMQDLGEAGAGAGAIDTAGDAGAVSADFVKAKADRTLQEGNRLSAIAREAARARAPGRLMTAEGLRRGSVLSDVGSLWSSARAMNSASGMAAQSVEEPAYGTFGRIAASIGGSMAGGSGGRMGPSRMPLQTGNFARMDRGQIGF